MPNAHLLDSSGSKPKDCWTTSHTSIVGVTTGEQYENFELRITKPVVYKRQWGVDGDPYLQDFFVALRNGNQGWSLVWVVEDNPHEVVKEQGSLQFLRGKGGLIFGGWAVASKLKNPQEEQSSQCLLHERWSRPVCPLLMGDKAVDGANILGVVHLVPLQPKTLVRSSQLEASPGFQGQACHQTEGKRPSTSSTVRQCVLRYVPYFFAFLSSFYSIFC